MDTTQANLYQRIEAFSLDTPGSALTFTQRLARDNRWRADYARRVTREYKRFAFLAMEAGHPVTPSDPVDQAWHLHLVYTDSYWNAFCGDVLGRPLHHGPTRGGHQEHQKHVDWYSKTLISYEHFFGPPPQDIWPPVGAEFGRHRRFARIDQDHYWVILKPRWPWVVAAMLLAALIVSALGCGAVHHVHLGSAATDWIRSIREVPGLFYFLIAVAVFAALAWEYGFASKGRRPQRGRSAYRGLLVAYLIAVLGFNVADVWDRMNEPSTPQGPTPRESSLSRSGRQAAGPVVMFVEEAPDPLGTASDKASASQPLGRKVPWPGTGGPVKANHPFDLPGPTFLIVYLLVAGAAVVTALGMRRWLRLGSHQPTLSPARLRRETDQLDVYEIAYLSGGWDQAIDTAITNLVEYGHLYAQPSGKGLVVGRALPESCHRLERAVVETVSIDGHFSRLRSVLRDSPLRIDQKLDELGLLMSSAQVRMVRWVPALVLFAVTVLGAVKIGIGISRDKPVLFLVALCCVTGCIGLAMLLKPRSMRNQAGDGVLRDLRVQHSGLRLDQKSPTENPVSRDPGLAVALFGPAVLAGTSLASLSHALKSRSPRGHGTTDGSGSGWWWGGCGSGCGASGCGGDGGGCGGGCGGCGG